MQRERKPSAEAVTPPNDTTIYSDTFRDPRYPGLEFEEGYIYAIEWPTGWFDKALAGRGAEVESFQEGENAAFYPGVRFRGKFRRLTSREIEECIVTGLLWFDRGFGPGQESVSRVGWDASVERQIQQRPASCAPETRRAFADIVKEKKIEVAE